MDNFYLSAYFNSTKDKDMYYINMSSSFLLSVFDKEKDDYDDINIGWAQLYLFNTDEAGWYNTWDSADSISGDVEMVVSVLEKAKEREEIYGLIAVLDHIEIDEEYRKKGYGTSYLKEIIEYISFLNVDYLGLIPVLRKSGEYQYSEKTNQFYIEKGFKPLATKLGEPHIMGLKLL